MTGIAPLIAGNWKMFGLRSAQREVKTLVRLLKTHKHSCDVVICPPATLLPILRQINRGGLVALGGQTCHAAKEGAHTGDISAQMLRDAGARYCIVGHSERRQAHGETDAHVRAQANAVLGAGLIPIICIGETDAQNQAGETEPVLAQQISQSCPEVPGLHDLAQPPAIAYEPVWAIGTGRTPRLEDIAKLHAFVKGCLVRKFGAAGSRVRVLYGGSVKPDNAAQILALPGVDGALVGGASLKARDFLTIIRASGRAAIWVNRQ